MITKRKTYFKEKEIKTQHNWFDFIFGKEIKGFLKIRNGSTNTQRFANIDNMRDEYKYKRQLNARYFTGENMYMSLCTYKKAGVGTQSNISAVQGFQLDIDYKNIKGYRERKPEEILNLLEYDYINKEIPIPNIIEIGNNIRLIYIFDKPIGATGKSLALINKIIRVFTLALNDIGSDKQTVNSMIRVCSSINTKNYSEVKYALYSEYKYSLNEIQELWLEPYYKKIRKKNNIEIKKNKDSNIIPFRKNFLTLSYDRALDLETLVSNRNGYCNGMRMKIIYMYKNFLLCSNMDTKKVDEKVEELNSKFVKPLKRKEAEAKYLNRRKKITKNSAAIDELYLFKNETIIEELQISEKEQKNMRTIISKEEKKERNKKRWKKYRDEHRVGLSMKEKKEINLRNIEELRKKGYTQKEVAEELKLGIATVKRYCKIISQIH